MPGPVLRDGLEPVSIHLRERDGQVPNTGNPGQGDRRGGDGWGVQATAPSDSLEGPGEAAEESPDLEHTRGGAWQGRGGSLKTVLRGHRSWAPEATHPPQGLAAARGEVNHPRLPSGMWSLRKVTRMLLLHKHS